jgi:hypothetical protein
MNQVSADIQKMRVALLELTPNKNHEAKNIFRSLLPEIEQALLNKCPVKVIWKSLRDLGLHVSLATFRKWLVERGELEEMCSQ